MSSAPDDKNASNPSDPDDQLDNQTREFVDALDHGSFAVENIDAKAETTGLHVVEALLGNVGQRNALAQYAKRYGFDEVDVAAGRTDTSDTARVRFCRRVDDADSATGGRDGSWRDSPVPVLPDDWSHRHGDGDVFEHDDTDLEVTISKRYGRTACHDDVKWTGTIRRGGGHGEPLTWGGTMTRAAVYAIAAKFAAGTPDGEYDPEEHLPDRAGEYDRPRWPDVLGYGGYAADQDAWLADETETMDGDA